MKRIELIKKLVKEGMSEKTLANFSDKQIFNLSQRMLGEASVQTVPTTVYKMSDPKDANAVNNLLNNPAAAKVQQQKGPIKVQTSEDKKLNSSAGKRADQVAQGAYDGRFKSKVVPDKKKEASKNWAKDKKNAMEVSEEKPSAGLSKEKKSEVVKKAKKGGDIGKKGKGFEKLADKAAKKYGSKEAGQKVAAAAMWKNIHEEKKNITKNWVKNLVENEYFHNFTSKEEIMELIQVKLNENQPAPSQPRPETPVREKPTTKPGKPKRENPFEPKHEPGPKAVKKTEEDSQKIKLPNALKFNSIGIKFKDQK
jgi:hypothetical protein